MPEELSVLSDSSAGYSPVERYMWNSDMYNGSPLGFTQSGVWVWWEFTVAEGLELAGLDAGDYLFVGRGGAIAVVVFFESHAVQLVSN